jgi:pyruvate-formate lyase-activating enzyme
MFITHLTAPGKPQLMRFSGRDVPHATVELTSRCNMACRACYNLYRDHEKTLDQVRREVDTILTLRNVQAITLLGGEPTLYPYLAEVVEYVRSKGVFCQVLTNGLIFFDDEGDRLLGDLRRANVDRMLVHIDEGQLHVYESIERARQLIFEKLDRLHITFGLSITVYPEFRGQLAGLARRYAHFRRFDGLLAVLAKDPLEPEKYPVDLRGEYDALEGQMQVTPGFYLASRNDKNRAAWLIYGYLINAKTGMCVAMPQALWKFFRYVYAQIKKRQLLIVQSSRFSVIAITIMTGVFSLLKGGEWLRLLKCLLHKSGLLKNLRLHSIVIQTPPWYDEENGRLDYCHACPDATIRNGQLMPVCFADMLLPHDAANPVREDVQERFQTVISDFALELPRRDRPPGDVGLRNINLKRTWQ